MIKKYLFLFVGFPLFIYGNSLFATEYIKNNQAQVRFLNKYTGKTELATLKVGQTYIFDKTLNVLLRACYKSSVQDEPENKAFLQAIRVITDNNKEEIKSLNIPKPRDFTIKTKDGETTKFIFSGWLFSSSPSVNYLEDKTYDITLLKCF